MFGRFESTLSCYVVACHVMSRLFPFLPFPSLPSHAILSQPSFLLFRENPGWWVWVLTFFFYLFFVKGAPEELSATSESNQRR